MIAPDNLVLILGSGALVLLILAGIVISRSWGNFPTRIQMPPELQAPRPNQNTSSNSAPSSQPSFQGFRSNQSEPNPASFRSNQPSETSTVYGFGTSAAPSSGDQTSYAPIVITNSLIRQAAEQALRQGAPQARHFMRQNDQIYITFENIPDPGQRQKAYEVITAMQQGNGQNIGLRETLLLIRQLA